MIAGVALPLGSPGRQRHNGGSKVPQQAAGSAVHPARAVERYPAARHDHVEMRMVGRTLDGLFRSKLSPLSRIKCLPAVQSAESRKLSPSGNWAVAVMTLVSCSDVSR